MLSGMSRGAGLVLTAKSEVGAEACRVHPAGADQGAGRARRRRTATSKIASSTCRPASPRRSCTKASNFLNAHIRGRTLAEAPARLPALGRNEGRARYVVAGSGRARHRRVGRCAKATPTQLIVRGRANLLEDVTAQADLERLQHLVRRSGDEGRPDRSFSTWRKPARACGSSSARKTSLFSLSGSSLIVAPYRDNDVAHRRRSRRHRADAAELCAHRADGRLYGAVDFAAVAQRLTPPAGSFIHALIFSGRTSISGTSKEKSSAETVMTDQTEERT